MEFFRNWKQFGMVEVRVYVVESGGEGGEVGSIKEGKL